MFITCQLIDLLLIVEQKLQAIKCALPLGNERSPWVTCDHVKIKHILLFISYDTAKGVEEMANEGEQIYHCSL